MTMQFRFDNSYARFQPPFHASMAPRPVAAPRLVKLNHALALDLGLDPEALESGAGAEIFAGARMPDGASPVALAYAGHQFGQFVPQLGDGRALLLGEVVTPDGRRRDIQLKGSGPTPFSRGGDGLAALGPVLREYVVSEAMAALGIPTTRALAVVATGESVFRETLLPGAVLTRVASSHIRVGTFQFFAARGLAQELRQLADHAIQRHDPDAAQAANPYRAFLEGVMTRQAELVARWLLVGFVHGVMNTDNTSISGETIDYGPCAFLDAYDPATVFSSIDRGGRYAYENQPAIAQWNLARLAECLLPLLAPTIEEAAEWANAALARMMDRLNAAYRAGLAAKIGLPENGEGDAELAHDLLEAMAAGGADFTLTFRRLGAAAADPAADASIRVLFAEPGAFDAWSRRWRARLEAQPIENPSLRREAMDRVNPAFIPRNHRIEAMIAAAVENGDFAPFEEILAVLSDPYRDQPRFAGHGEPAPEGRGPYRTFCGT